MRSISRISALLIVPGRSSHERRPRGRTPRASRFHLIRSSSGRGDWKAREPLSGSGQAVGQQTYERLEEAGAAGDRRLADPDAAAPPIPVQMWAFCPLLIAATPSASMRPCDAKARLAQRATPLGLARLLDDEVASWLVPIQAERPESGTRWRVSQL
jgi:hypothetical protein